MNEQLKRTAPPKIQREPTHHIRAWRQHRQLTIPQLAEKARVTSSFVSQLERGHCRYTESSLAKIAEALETRPWQLLAGPPSGIMELLFDKPILWESLPKERHPEADALLIESAEAAYRSALKVWGKKER